MHSFKYFKLTLYFILLAIFVNECISNPAIMRKKQTLSNNQALTDQTKIQNPSKLRCGQVSSTSTGFISYKSYKRTDNLERCLWTVAVPGAKGYSIDLLFLGDKVNKPGSGEQRLLFTGVQYVRQRSPLLDNYIPSTTGTFTVSNSNIMIVSFSTIYGTTATSRGFVFRYEALFSGNINATSALSTHHILETPVTQFKYPVNERTVYQNHELASLIIPPGKNKYTSLKTHIWFEKLGLEGCMDAVYVYKFKASAAGDYAEWQPAGKICDSVNNQFITNVDTFLLLFSSDQSVQKAGFNISASSC